MANGELFSDLQQFATPPQLLTFCEESLCIEQKALPFD